jgi:hypothetical protein
LMLMKRRVFPSVRLGEASDGGRARNDGRLEERIWFRADLAALTRWFFQHRSLNHP